MDFEAFDFDTGRERFALNRCLDCGTVRNSPLFGAGEIARYYYAGYYGNPGDRKFAPPIEWLSRAFQAWRARELMRNLDLGDGTFPRVLDVGCGRGAFLKYLSRTGQARHCVGLEIDGFVFPEQTDGVEFRHGTIESLAETLPEGSFDAISIWHVLEHLPEPGSALEAARRLLRPGGILAIAVPNYGSAQSGFFGPYWFHLDLPRHLFHFTPDSLSGLLRKRGFEAARLRTGSWDQDVFGFIQSAQNRFLGGIVEPNLLYSLLKAGGAREGRQSATLATKVMIYGAGAILALPALVDYLAGKLTGRGATLIVYARSANAP